MTPTAYYLYTRLAPGDPFDPGAEARRRAHFRLLKSAGSPSFLRATMDGVVAVYDDATDAISAGIALRRTLRRQAAATSRDATAGAETALGEIAIAVHAGPPIRDDEDLLGEAVHAAGRLCEAAARAGAGILASAEVLASADRLPAGAVSVDLPPLELAPGLTMRVGEVVARPPAAGMSLPAALRNPPAIDGRDEALATLVAAWRQACDGRPRVVLVHGPRGAGRTSLAAALAHDTGEDDRVVAYARCHPGRPGAEVVRRALRPYAEFVGEPIVGEHVAAAGSAAASVIGPAAAIDPAGGDCPEAAAAVLADIALDSAVLLVVDDIEHADDQMTATIDAIAELDGARVMVVAVCDPLEVRAGNAAGEWLRSCGAARVRVGRMSPDVLSGIAARLAPDDADVAALADADLAALADAADGLPGDLVELVRCLRDTGVRAAGALEAAGLRLAARADDCRSLVREVARSGGEARLADLRESGDLADAFEAALEEAVAAEMLDVHDGDVVCAGPLVVAVAWPGMPPVPPADADLTAASPSGGTVPAADTRAAASVRTTLPAATSATVALEPVQPHGANGTAPSSARQDGLGAIVESFPDAFSPPAARDALSSARGDDGVVATMVEELLDAVDGRTTDGRGCPRRVEVSAGAWRAWADGRTSQALALADGALVDGEEEVDDVAPLVATRIAASIRLGLLNPQGARGILLRELLRRRRDGLHAGNRRLLAQLVVVDALSGRVPEALALAGEEHLEHDAECAEVLAACRGLWDAAEDAAQAAGVPAQRPLSALPHTLRARHLRLRGSFDEAQQVLDAALEQALLHRIVPGELLVRAELTILAADRGTPEGASAHRMRCLQVLADGEEWEGLSGRVDLAEAAAEAAIGRADDAAELFRRAIRTFERYTLPWDRAEALTLMARTLRRWQRSGAERALAEAAEVYKHMKAGRGWCDLLGAPA